jgi:hypothetical protein
VEPWSRGAVEAGRQEYWLIFVRLGKTGAKRKTIYLWQMARYLAYVAGHVGAWKCRQNEVNAGNFTEIDESGARG